VALQQMSLRNSPFLFYLSVTLPFLFILLFQFLSLLKTALANQPTVPLYYTGAAARRDNAITRYRSKATVIKGTSYIGDANEADDVALVDCGTFGEPGFDSKMLCEEAFTAVLAVVELPGFDGDVGKYMVETCVPFCNREQICGSLGCTVLIQASDG